MMVPVLRTLAQRNPDLRFTVRSSAPESFLREQLPADVRLLPATHDRGMAMRDALDVDLPASLDWYRALYADWDRRIEAAAGELAALEPDAVISNIPFVPLAAAARVGIPAAALCCLNWADVFEHYGGKVTGGSAIVSRLRGAYAGADLFLAPEPAMPMPWLPNRLTLPPVARLGHHRGDELRRRLGAGPGDRVVLVSLGGVPFRLDVSAWPRFEGLHVIAGAPVDGAHASLHMAATLDMPWIDLLASSDAVLTKPGYGTVAEAACNGIPVLYLPRDGWPEEPFLLEWLRRHGRCLELSRDDLAGGRLVEPLETLLAQPAPPCPSPSGVAQAAESIELWLDELFDLPGEAPRASLNG
jgi:hypothetical protein